MGGGGCGVWLGRVWGVAGGRGTPRAHLPLATTATAEHAIEARAQRLLRQLEELSGESLEQYLK